MIFEKGYSIFFSALIFQERVCFSDICLFTPAIPIATSIEECELQGYICGVLTSLVSRLRDQIAPLADKIMEEALKAAGVFFVPVLFHGDVEKPQRWRWAQHVAGVTESQYIMPLFRVDCTVLIWSEWNGVFFNCLFTCFIL